MKKIIMAVLLFSSTAVLAQRRYNNDRYQRNNEPPSSVRRSFERDNPSLNATWRRDNNEWHATFRDNNNRDVDAYYDSYGRRKVTHTRWGRNEVPRDLDDRINRTYHTTDYNATRIERPNGRPLFQITFQSRGRNRKIYMDERGREQRYYDNH